MIKAKHVIARISMATALCATVPLAAAAEYVVQIGAFKYPPSSTINSLTSYGEILEESTGSGLTRILVGTFDSHGAATGVRDQLRDQGYPDAFVTRFGGQNAYADNSGSYDDYDNGAEDSSYSSASTDTQGAYETAKSLAPAAGGSSSQSMAALTEEEKLRAVFLDGQLKMKVGDEFLTLDEYRARY